MNIYEISKHIEAISEMVDEDGVLLPEAESALNDLQMEETEKFKNLGGLIVNMKSEKEALKAEAKRLSDRAKILENKESRLKDWIKFVLESKKGNMPIKAGIFTFSLRSFESVAVDESAIESMDEKYLRIKKEANKTEIKKDLKLGIDIEGASIVKSNSVIIK